MVEGDFGEKPIDFLSERRKRGMPEPRAPMQGGASEAASAETSPQGPKKRAELRNLLMQGKFSELREGVAQKGREGEVRYVLNTIDFLGSQGQTLPQHWQTDINQFARVLFNSEPRSQEYFSALFARLREAGFTAHDKVEIRKSFARLATETSTNLYEDEKNDKTYINAMLALESAFPEE